MKCRFLFASLFCLLITVGFAEVVEEIKIINLSRVNKSSVIKAFKPFERQNFDVVAKKIPATLKRLYNTGQFKDINVSFEQNVLIVELHERPVVTSIEVVGLSENELDEDDIKEVLSNYFNVGDQFDESLVVQAVENILAVYRLKGYFSAKVDIEFETLSLNRVKLKVMTKENSLSRVEKIMINGVRNFPVNQIEGLLLFEAQTLLSSITDSDVFSVQKLEASLDRIKSFYLEQGYLDFKILSYDWVQSLGSEALVVYLNMKEGFRYQVNSVNLLSALRRNHAYFEPLINIKTGAPYQHSQLGEMITKIQNVYQSFGYSYGEVNYEVKKNAELGLVDIFLSVKSSIVSYVYRIDFMGNSKTYDDVLRQELVFSEGQIFSKQALDDSVGRLNTLGFFNNVSYEITPYDNHPSLLVVRIMIDEKQNTGQWNAGGAYSNAGGFSYNMSFQQPNFLGSGDDIQASFNKALSTMASQFKVQYNDRRFNESDANLLSEVSYLISDNSVNSYQTDVYSAKVVHQQILSQKAGTYFNVGLRGSMTDLSCSASFKLEETLCSYSRLNLYNIDLSYIKNKLKTADFPIDGNLFSFTVGAGLGDFTYPKAELGFKSYSTSDSITLRAEASLKAIFAKPEEVPFFNRYFLDNASTIRGFNTDQFADRYTSVNQSKGGNLVTVLKLEAAYNPSEQGIDGVRLGVFVDTGYIHESVDTFSFSNIRASAGLSAHWMSPFGPVSLFKAWPILEQATDTFSKDFTFSLGNNF